MAVQLWPSVQHQDGAMVPPLCEKENAQQNLPE